jgi:hypothetical protein
MAIHTAVHKMADVKNSFGFGKNEWNTFGTHADVRERPELAKQSRYGKYGRNQRTAINHPHPYQLVTEKPPKPDV